MWRLVIALVLISGLEWFEYLAAFNFWAANGPPVAIPSRSRSGPRSFCSRLGVRDRIRRRDRHLALP